MHNEYNVDQENPNLLDNKLPYWVELIAELVNGAGYSYSRIAYCIGVSPSTIQKLATNHSRKPCHLVFHRLLVLYYKVFYSPLSSPQVSAYIKQKEKKFKKSMRFENPSKKKSIKK